MQVDAREHGFSLWVGKIIWEGTDNLLQYSCLENSRDRGAWRATVHGVTESQTRLSVHAHTKFYESKS